MFGKLAIIMTSKGKWKQPVSGVPAPFVLP